MNVIPAIDILEGQAVQLRGGDPDQRLFESDDPVGHAQRFVDEGAEMLHVIDLGRTLDGYEASTDIVHEIVEASPVPVQIGGGLRGARAIREFLDPHPDAKAIVATRAWKQPHWLDHLTEEWPERIIVGLELKQGTIAVEGWTERTKLTFAEGLHRIDGLDLGGVLFTDIDREGTMIGPNIDTTREAVEELDVPVIASGGISTTDHIHELEDAGAWGCVIGTALYNGELDFERARQATQEAPQ